MLPGSHLPLRLNLMRKLFSCSFALISIAACATAGESLMLVPGETAVVTIPAQPPFLTLGSTRLEMRISSRNTPSANAPILQLNGFTILLMPTGEVCGFDNFDSMPDRGNGMCADVTGKSDIIVRLQRDTVMQQLEMEVRTSANDWNAVTYCGTKSNGTQGNTTSCPIAAINTWSWAGAGTFGGNLTSTQLAWVKWYSAVVPAGTGSFAETNPADLADWRFDTGMVSVANYPVTIGALQAPSNSQGAFVGVVSAATPVSPPACSAGQTQVFRAGYNAQLDGTQSYPLDGGAGLQYSWSQVSGPVNVQWSSTSAAQPTVSGLVFGSYVFQLTVTDSSGQQTSCTIKDGAVATDSNNVVITGNSALDALIGPQIRFGANPWPWFDNRHKAAADVQNADLNPYYSSYWDTPGTGTVTVTPNSTTVTGFGTSFTTTFCQGPANPTQPKSVNGDGVSIIVWYPTSVAGQTGRRSLGVASCQSDTSLTIWNPWGTDVSGGSNLNYTYSDDNVAGNWIFNPDPANFYDNVAAFYTLYYRSGLDDYLTAARTLADRFWLSPIIDRGASCGPNAPSTCTFPRNLSLLGLTLRALDGRSDMWPGLHLVWDKFMSYDLALADPIQGQISDLREEAYQLSFISYCALVDTDPNYRAKCKASISQAFANIWTPFRFPDGSWPTLYYGGMGGSPGYSSWDTGSTVTLTNGSTTVIGNGTSWGAGYFPSSCVQGSGGCAMWFTNTPGRPTNNAGGDNTFYTPTFVDATHLTLDRPYQGASGTHGWALSGPLVAGLLGWGVQPYMLGIAGTAFDYAARAIADTDPTTSALAHSYTVSAANWLKTNGYWPDEKGLYYGAGFVNCQAPISDSNAVCTAGNTQSAARTLSSEVMRAVGTAYAYSGDSSLQLFGDTLYSAMYSKPGTGGPNPDGYYVSDWDDVWGWYMYGAPPAGKAPKYFGMFFGFGDNSTWPAYRLGSASTVVSSLASVPLQPSEAAQVRIILTAPDGEVSESLCGSSHCSVNIDPRQGAHRVTVQYLETGGKLLFSEEKLIRSKE